MTSKATISFCIERDKAWNVNLVSKLLSTSPLEISFEPSLMSHGFISLCSPMYRDLVSKLLSTSPLEISFGLFQVPSPYLPLLAGSSTELWCFSRFQTYSTRCLWRSKRPTQRRTKSPTALYHNQARMTT